MRQGLPCLILAACAWVLWEQNIWRLSEGWPSQKWSMKTAYETKAACEQRAVQAATAMAEVWARSSTAR